jgi:C1A family cysteine protease
MLAFATATVVVAINLDNPSLSVDSRWSAYKTFFGKTYVGAFAEESALAAFNSNDQLIQEHNSRGLSWTLGHNAFSDMTWEEFSAGHLGLNVEANRTKRYAPLEPNATYADAVDWVAKGAVSPVKDQAQCGSCWAFSTVGSIEGAYQIGGNNLTQFSEQDLVSCDNYKTGGSDAGCNGGLMDDAFTWIKTNGLCSEADYPYTSGTGNNGKCKIPKCRPVVTLTGFTDVKGEKGMIPAINVGPVSVAIEADQDAFQLYKSGVLDSRKCGKQLDHGVLVVAYGTDATLGKDYYKVKNSWGASWGEAGYIRMVRGKDQCGIADSASYPTGVVPVAPTPPTPPTPPPTPMPTDTCAGCIAHLDKELGTPDKAWCVKKKKCYTDTNLPEGCWGEDLCISDSKFCPGSCAHSSNSTCGGSPPPN